MDKSLDVEKLNKLIDHVTVGSPTLFIVDETEGEQTFDIFKQSASYVVLDADVLNMKKNIQKQSVSFILEECRFKLTFAMKYGKILVVRFGNSMTDFKFTFCDEFCPELTKRHKGLPRQLCSYLPRGFMMNSGQGLRDETIVRALYRREDLVEMLLEGDEENSEDFLSMVPVCHPSFKVVMTTTMPFDKLDDFHFHSKYGLPAQRAQFDIRRLNLSDEATPLMSHP